MRETVFLVRNSRMKPFHFSGFLLANILVCLWIGYLLDLWMHSRPFWMMALLLYAVIGSFVLLIRKGKNKNG